MENGESMKANEAQDRLKDITDKIEYLTSTHFAYLNEVNEGGCIPSPSEICGYMDLNQGILKELRTFYTELEPLLFPSKKALV
ncbi:MAG: Unknown protein [uncultured Sulfurovum sp.]|uniref:Uncharacterized protein n=1 Tax=uncultured Sulfurovum sp. TaxID=269237 RepID=A0A6S6S8F4_9BACT|nr:MAG: Unknown protein [uncultured Sulfurovum sp.]